MFSHQKMMAGIACLVMLGQSGCCGPICELHKLAAESESCDQDTGMTGGGVDLLTIPLPFAEDYQSLCTQGANGSYSHHSRSTRYDVDLDTPNNAVDPVYAPVGGIAYRHDEDSTKNYGNHITIDLDDGTYILLAHLNDILIEDGEQVAAGELIGHEGHTGMADGDHVHTGRHSGDATKMGEYGTSINALAFEAFDATTGQTVTEMTTEMSCSLEYGHTYQSTLTTPKWHPSGSLLKTPTSSTVYLLDGFTLHPFLNEEAFTSRKYSWDDVVLIEEDEIACFALGNTLSGSGLITAVYDTTAYTGAWLIVGTADDPDRYRRQILTTGASAVLATWNMFVSSVYELPSPSAVGVTLSDYPVVLDHATFRDGSLVSTNEKSDVYVMEGGAALPIVDWNTYLLMGFHGRTVHELSQSDFDVLVEIMGSCATDSYCIANNDVTTCGGDTEDVPGTYPGEGGAEEEVEEEDTAADVPSTVGTGIGLELWWQLAGEAEWITISGQFTNENSYSYSWNSNIAWSTWSNELYFSIADAGSGDSFRYSYAFFMNGVENWSCLGPFPPGVLTGTPTATYNGEEIAVEAVADPAGDGCGLEVTIP